MNTTIKLLAASVTFAVNGLASQWANAQSGTESSVLLEEVIVTAERRSADVQDIPIAMTVMTAEMLGKKSVTRLDDLQFASPGLTITDAGLTQSINIRGIGLASPSAAVANGVATYVDGLFQPPIVTTNSFFDIASVSVLRGPQGTFEGANSTGGAIKIEGRRAEVGAETNGYGKLGLGNYSSKTAEGAIGLPLGDIAALRVAVNSRDRDSFYNSVGSVPGDAGSLDELDVRIGLAVQPVDALDLYFKYEDADKSTGGYAYRPIPTTPFAAGRVGGIRDLDYNSPTKNDETADTLMFEATYELASGIALSWLSGDQEKHIENLYDNDGSSIGSSNRLQVVTEKQRTHEFNIVSPDDGDFQWVAGVYYQQNKIDVDIKNPTPNILIHTTKTTRGLFGQVGYNFTSDMQVEFGLRKAWFKAENDPSSGVYIIPGPGKVANIDGAYDDDDVMGKLSFNWTLDNNNLLYALVAKGYKPGGINSATSFFDKEQVWSYEAGWKATMLDGRVRTSLDIFYNDYSDFQNNRINLATGQADVFNIADATIQGVEFSLEARFGELYIDGSLAYVDSELSATTDLVNTRALPGSNLGPQCAAGVASNPPVCFDYSPFHLSTENGPNLFSPEYTFNLGVEYHFNLNNGATLIPRLNYAWIDEQWTNLIYNEETDLLDSRGLLSASLTYEVNNWQVQAYGRNLADKEYVSGQIASFNGEFYGAPREYGITASYAF